MNQLLVIYRRFPNESTLQFLIKGSLQFAQFMGIEAGETLRREMNRKRAISWNSLFTTRNEPLQSRLRSHHPYPGKAHPLGISAHGISAGNRHQKLLR